LIACCACPAELVAAEGVEKTLRIVVTSGLVKRGAFLEALEERLAPPLQAAGELAALAAFRSQFDAASFRKGLEITFVASGSRLTTKIDGKQVGCCLALCPGASPGGAWTRH
jgi:hypothetical protein